MSMKIPNWVPIIALCFALSACKEVLYSEISENNANEMVAVLEAYGVDATRTRDKDGLYSINVDGENVGAAVTILKAKGLPRATYASMGQIFADEGIAGTAFEEKARFMHALSEELSKTVAGIKGVRSSRVHVILPEVPRFAKETPQSSASVVLYHEAGFEPAKVVPTIKTIVSHGVPNLDYDNVVVAFFPVEELSITKNLQEPPWGAAQASVLREVSNLDLTGTVLEPYLPADPAVRTSIFLALFLLMATLTTVFLIRVMLRRLVVSK